MIYVKIRKIKSCEWIPLGPSHDDEVNEEEMEEDKVGQEE